jgi:hypothetical protein
MELLLRWLTGQSGGTPDSPVNYSEGYPWNSREWPVRVYTGLVHRTLSGAHQILFGAPQFSPLLSFCSIFYCVPNQISFLVCVEPYAPDEVNDI